MLGSLGFLLGETLRNLRRQGLMALASISTTAIALLLLGLFLLVGWQIYAVLEGAPRRLEIHAFVRESVGRRRVEEIAVDVRRYAGVTGVELVPREQAWEEFRRKSGHQDVLAGFDENPLPDKLRITTTDPRAALAVAATLRAVPEIDTVNDRAEVLRQLITIFNVVQTVGLVIGTALGIGTALLISNTIRLTLYARRRDIRVMQLVGATNAFIRFPFMMEGVASGTVGGLLASLALFIGTYYYNQNLLPKLPLVNQFQPTVSLPLVVLGLIATGALIGLLGSMFSLRRFLHAS